MATLLSTMPKPEDDEPHGGPIGALLIAIPISLLLWGAAVFALLNLVR